jgi:hypothetical protein
MSGEGFLDPAEVAGVPRWGRVAFAARCARRVQEFFHFACADAGPEFVDVTRAAIEHAEKLAADPPDPPSPTALSAEVEIGLFRAVYRASDTSFLAVERAFRIALHAHRAASCAVFDSIPHNPDKDSDVSDVVGAGRIALSLHCRPCVLRDWESLVAAASRGWTDSTAVPVTFFGPMWPQEIDPSLWGDAARLK